MAFSYNGGYTISGKECLVCTRPVPVFVLAPQSQLLWNSFTFGQGHQGQVDLTLAVLTIRLTNHFQDLTRNSTQSDFCSNCCKSKLDLRDNVTCTELMKFGNLLNQLVASINGTIDKIQKIFTPTENNPGQIQHYTNGSGNGSITTEKAINSSSPLNEFCHDDDDSLNNVTPDSPSPSPEFSEVENSSTFISETSKPQKATKRGRRKKLKSKTGLSHLAKGDRRRDDFVCTICSKVLSAQIHLDSHMLLHSNEKPFECNICKKKFRHNPALFLHMRRIHQGVKPYKCDVCERPFSTKWKMNEHKKTHTKEKLVLCELCPKQWLSFGYLRGHMRYAHPETFGDKYAPEKLIKCNFCDKKFMYPHLQRRHELSSHKVEERPFPCEICGKRFVDLSKLTRHASEVHLQIRRVNQTTTCNHQCIECKKTFPRPSLLKSHMNVHENSKLVKCDICSANVPKKLIRSHLNRHEKPDVRLRRRKWGTRQKSSEMSDVITIKEEDSCFNQSRLMSPQLKKEVKIQLTRVERKNFKDMDVVKEEIAEEMELECFGHKIFVI